MEEKVKNWINYTFYALFFFVPLVLFPKSSELFEFNKMVLTYGLTTIIVALWLIRIILVKKFIFKRTALDIPILIFLGTQFLSTITSIDFRTSLLGYYSRYHGGFMSSFSYVLLYWAYVSNMDNKKNKKAIYMLFASAVLVSIYGILERFGIDKDLWVQDVQNRVFSTLGQPNWLAAWLTALIPITWALSLESRIKNSSGPEARIKSHWIYVILSSLFFLTLLYTKSRSGLLGFMIADVLFWPAVFWINLRSKKVLKSVVLKSFVIFHLSFVIFVSLVGTPWTPGVEKYLKQKSSQQKVAQEKSKTDEKSQIKYTAPALEVRISGSDEIRKIVWRGAIDIWKNYPILGTGVETFAFSYYNFRPVEHNLVSEWDFLYNKAHNEYLNLAATTGSVGLFSYGFLILAVILLFLRKIDLTNYTNQSQITRKNIGDHSQQIRGIRDMNRCLNIGFLSGVASILVTNFFGFSVVPVALLFFLYPAMAVALGRESGRAGERELNELSGTQKAGILISCSLALLLLYSVSKYWYADYLYANGKAHNDVGNSIKAKELLENSVRYSPNEAVFWIELAESDTDIALVLIEQGNEVSAQNFARSAISESDKAVKLSPANVNLKRKRASMFIKLSTLNPNFLINARETLIKATQLAPTDAKLSYNLALVYVRTGENEKGIDLLAQTVDMKPNYRGARYALALLYIDEGETDKARSELKYILERIDPNDKLVKQELAELEE